MKILGVIALALGICLMHDEIPDNLKMNRIQVIGSHNSYKRAIDPALFKMFQQKDSVSASKLDYEHISIAEQLDMGLLNLEIDVYPDEKGGRFAHPKGLQWVPGQAPFDEKGVMNEPGFKVLHVPDLDFRNDYLTLKNLLAELKNWSDKHPDHYPIFITLEPKDGTPKNAEMTVPEPFTPKTYEELDKALIAGLGKAHIITPDMVRGKYKTLEDAVLHDNWPTLKDAKGKFAFLLDANDAKRDMYIAGHLSLKGRVMFANVDPGNPEAAMLFRNTPTNAEIKDLVAKGYIIRTRADADTREARLNDKSNFVAACNSGAQIITTDYYKKSTHFVSDYEISFDGKKYVRLNPVLNDVALGGSK